VQLYRTPENPTVETDSVAEEADRYNRSQGQIPCSREFSREFFEKRAFSGDSGLKNVCEISGLQRNSLLAGAGNFFEWSREFYRRSRELAPVSRAG
jgi:hypothetical protein